MRIQFYHLSKQSILPNDTYSEARRDSNLFIILLFHSQKITARHDIIHISDDLHISIEIDASVMIQNPESGIVADESIFAGSISLTSVRDCIYIKIAFIPASDFIFRKELLPGRDTFLCTSWERLASEPAIVYYLLHLL